MHKQLKKEFTRARSTLMLRTIRTEIKNKMASEWTLPIMVEKVRTDGLLNQRQRDRER